MRRGTPSYDYRHPLNTPGGRETMQRQRSRPAPHGEDRVGAAAPKRLPPDPPTARRFRGQEGGAAAIEFALIMPLLVLFVFGIIGFGLAFMQMQTIRGALREGGRAAA